MELDKKDIYIELRTVIDDGGEKELSIVKQQGKYYKKNKLEVITYTDQTDIGEIKNLITIQANKVNLNRSGNVRMNQQFILGKKTECLYKHPYGTFHIEINTSTIMHKALQEKDEGKVIIEYDAKINGQQAREHHLTLTYGGERT